MTAVAAAIDAESITVEPDDDTRAVVKRATDALLAWRPVVVFAQIGSARGLVCRIKRTTLGFVIVGADRLPVGKPSTCREAVEIGMRNLAYVFKGLDSDTKPTRP